MDLNSNQSALIDFIRGIAAQLVLVGHLLVLFGHDPNIIVQNLGVVVFFILSGHLITISALRLHTESKFNVRRFLLDRFLRIYIALLPAILVCILFDFVSIRYYREFLLFDISNLNIKNFIFSIINVIGSPVDVLSFIFPYFSDVEPIGSMRPLWSVAIEWWLYIFIAVVFYTIRSMKLIAYIIFSLALILIITHISRESVSSYYVIYSWLTASFFTIINVKNILSRLTPKVLVLISSVLFFSLIILVVLEYVTTFYEYQSILLILPLYFVLITLGERFQYPKILMNFSIKLSSFSYSLYLLHYSLICFLLSIFETRTFEFAITIYIFINLFCFLFYYLFERHYMWFRKLSIYKKLTKI
jgi:peptidoglycan/LPS O-acetylase OafA/YrhL